MNHTPTPWKVEQGQGYHEGHWVITAAEIPANSPLAHVQQTCGPDESYPDAQFIARACNAHEELLMMLQRLTEKAARINNLQHSKGAIRAEDWSELYQLTSESRALIAKAEGKGISS